jgi:hypothetical protein
VLPSNANAAAPNNTRRLLTVGGRLGTCNILPLPARPQRGDKACMMSTHAAVHSLDAAARLPLAAAALAYR